MVKRLDQYKIDDILDDDCFEKDSGMNNLLKKPIKLVAIGYTLQDADRTQAEIKLKSKDFIEDEDDDFVDDEFGDEDDM